MNNNILAQCAALSGLGELLLKAKRECNANLRVVFYTAIGRTVCDIEPLADEDAFFAITDDPTAFTIDLSAAFNNKHGIDAQVINARNVVIYNKHGQESIRTEQMIIFVDQIIGFSIEKQDA
ncbi:MAG: hypothetical protein FWE32_04975 [Oscillospiraceae bacterium]|nr:hypothetical protein [Oscillospiraceae bacterium]